MHLFYTLLPVVSYWTMCMFCYMSGFDTNKNIENRRNQVSLQQTIQRVAQLHLFQVLFSAPLENGAPFLFTGQVVPRSLCRLPYLLTGCFIVDTVEYWVHRLWHSHPFLYKWVHKTHHEMVCPWSFGALYNSYIEAALTGSCLVFVFFGVLDYSVCEFALVSTISNLATICDHCEFFETFDYFQKKRHHTIHHNIDLRCNFQQPFGTYWDRWCHTLYK